MSSWKVGAGTRAGRIAAMIAGMPGAIILAGCTADGASGRPGKDIVTPDFESYTTAHNGYSRVRRDLSKPGDAAILAQFDDADPASPAGYRSLIALDDKIYASRVTLEVIGKVTSTATGETTDRILRLTSDTEPFRDVAGGAQGVYHFRGASVAYVTIDGGPVLTGTDDRGLLDLAVDFDAATADISLRTGVVGSSEVEIHIDEAGLPFNVNTGAFGGDIGVSVRNPAAVGTYTVTGSLRGTIGGSPAYAGGQHDLVTSGLFTGAGTDAGHSVTVEGGFAGVDPNALP